jgi:hypothetical protein
MWGVREAPTWEALVLVAAAEAASVVGLAGTLLPDALVAASVPVAWAEVPGTPRCPLERISAPCPTPLRTIGICF